MGMEGKYCFGFNNLPTTKLGNRELSFCKGGLRGRGTGEFKSHLETCRGSFWFRQEEFWANKLVVYSSIASAVFPESLDNFFLAEKGVHRQCQSDGLAEISNSLCGQCVFLLSISISFCANEMAQNFL